MNPLHAAMRRLVFAAVTGIYLLSDRRQTALNILARMCRAETQAAPAAPWRLCVWNINDGFRVDGVDSSALQTLAAQVSQQTGQDIDLADPVSVIQCLKALRPANGNGSTILVLENAEEYMDRLNFRQALEKRLYEGKNDRTFVVMLSGVQHIHPTLAPLFRVLPHPHPSRDLIEKTIRQTCEPYGALPQDEAGMAALLGACGGMTETQVEQALAEALVDLPEGETISPRVIAASKREALAARGLSLIQTQQTAADVVGLDNYKRVFRSLLRDNLPATVKRRGVLALGIPGTGKTYSTAAIANEYGWQCMQWNPNNLKGSLQGETETNFRLTIQTIESQAREGGRLVLLIDEIEKLLVGMDPRAARSDGGVMAGVGGSFLSWLQDRPADTSIFVVGTCNDMSILNEASAGAFGRAGRFNATLFFDFPSAEQRRAAWSLYRAKMGIPANVPAIGNDDNMTPAEIAATCEAFIIYECQTLEQAKGYVPLVSVTAAEQISRLRQMANGRYISADRDGLFTLSAAAPTLAPSAPVSLDDEPPARPVRRSRKPDAGGLFGN